MALWPTLKGQQLQFSDSIQVSLLTCDPGQDIYSIYGHSALRLKDFKTGQDVVFNWGIFDFDTPGFALKFMRGKLPYKIGAYPYNRFPNQYIREKRAIREQVLDLTPIQQQKMLKQLAWNLQPENIEYPYDFFFDNCSSRIRDLLNQSCGPALQNTYELEGYTFRDIIKQYQGNRAWLTFGIDLIIGSRADKKVSVEDQMFIPDYLEKAFDAAQNDGKPLVNAKSSLYSYEKQLVKSPLISPNIVFWGLLLLCVIAYFFKKGLYLFLTKSFALLVFIVGIIGLVMWFLTDHQACALNWNILWASPIAIFYLLKTKSLSKVFNIYYIIVPLGLLSSWIWFPQSFNVAIIPILLLLFFMAWRQTNLPSKVGG